MNYQIFREYDIRGAAERDLDDELVTALGRALAEEFCANGKYVAVGQDCRLSSPRLFKALTDGLRDMGAHVLDIGVVPTPVLYFAAHHLDVAGSVIITGSHNPSKDNGFKLLKGREALHGETIRQLGQRIAKGGFVHAAARGSLEKRPVTDAYLSHAIDALRLGEKRLKVVVDAGNGAGGPTAVALLTALGFDVVPLYCDMNGAFPNHHPDPTVEANLSDLKRSVKEHGADVGLALDGDGDRIGAVDEHGRVLWGDQLMILFGRAILEELPGAKFVGEVKCSQALFDELEKAGGHAEMWKVGHSLIKARMKELGAQLGGEMSGHIFFAHRYLGFDDAAYAGARLLEILTHTDASLGNLRDTLPNMVNTPEIRVECSDDTKFTIVQKAARILTERPDVSDVVTIDGVRANFGDGWGLVRASNTQPALVVRCEASTGERLAEIQKAVESAIEDARHASAAP